MSRLAPRRRPPRPRGPLSLRPAAAAYRADPGEPAAPAPPPTPPDEPQAPPPEPTAPEPGPPPLAAGPPRQKLMLWASGVVVVLIVIVIIALGSRPRRRVLAYVPMGQSAVQAVDVRRFALGPVYRILNSADHPIAKKLEAVEETWDLSLKRDVVMLADADNLTIFVGHLEPKRLRQRFEEEVEKAERELNRSAPQPVRLKVVERDVEGHTYWACDQAGIDRAFAAVGSSVVCFGDGLGVRRFLRVHSGGRDHVLQDEHFAAAYAQRLARRAFLCRLEKPGGAILGRCLSGPLGETASGLRAACFVLSNTQEAIDVTVRLAAEGEQAAEQIQARLAAEEAKPALIELLGADAQPAVTRSGQIVALTSSLDLATFEAMVLKDVAAAGKSHSLVLALLAE